MQVLTKHKLRVKPVYNGELQKWPLLTGGLCLERQKLPIRFSRGKLKLALVDRTPLLAGDLVKVYLVNDVLLIYQYVCQLMFFMGLILSNISDTLQASCGQVH